jgi:hypothetical protein
LGLAQQHRFLPPNKLQTLPPPECRGSPSVFLNLRLPGNLAFLKWLNFMAEAGRRSRALVLASHQLHASFKVRPCAVRRA